MKEKDEKTNEKKPPLSMIEDVPPKGKLLLILLKYHFWQIVGLLIMVALWVWLVTSVACELNGFKVRPGVKIEVKQ